MHSAFISFIIDLIYRIFIVSIIYPILKNMYFIYFSFVCFCFSFPSLYTSRVSLTVMWFAIWQKNLFKKRTNVAIKFFFFWFYFRYNVYNKKEKKRNFEIKIDWVNGLWSVHINALNSKNKTEIKTFKRSQMID